MGNETARRLPWAWIILSAVLSCVVVAIVIAHQYSIEAHQKELEAQRSLLGEQVQSMARLKGQMSGLVQEPVARAIVRILSASAGRSATGFLHASGRIITAGHFVMGVDPELLMVVDSRGSSHPVQSVVRCEFEDLALLKLKTPLAGIEGLRVSQQDRFEIGVPLTVLGYPGGYGGGPPLATMGHLAGVEAKASSGRKLLVLNTAVNLGNSGGPVVWPDDPLVRGVVVAKMTPMPEDLRSVLTALKKDEGGKKRQFKITGGRIVEVSDVQAVAVLFEHLQSQMQLVIGYAVPASTIREFLTAQGLEP